MASLSDPTSICADFEAIVAATSTMFDERDVVELRAIFSRPRKRIASGYFDALHREDLARAAVRLNDDGGQVYVTLNPVTPDLLARASNRVIDNAQGTTGDGEIVRRRYVLIDVDPVRPRDTSATDAMKADALAVMRAVVDYLASVAVFPTLRCDSGNGYHAMLAVDLANDAESTDLVKRFLNALARGFDTPTAKVDTSVFNASRIVKLPGTVARKGDDVPTHPHRLSSILAADRIQSIDIDHMREIIGAVEGAFPAPVAPTRAQAIPAAPGNRGAFNMQAFIERNGIEVRSEADSGGWHQWKLAACPFNPEHVNGEAMLSLNANGAPAFKCLHNSCSSRTMRDVADLYHDEHARHEMRSRGPGRPPSPDSTPRRTGTPAVITAGVPVVEVSKGSPARTAVDTVTGLVKTGAPYFIRGGVLQRVMKPAADVSTARLNRFADMAHFVNADPNMIAFDASNRLTLMKKVTGEACALPGAVASQIVSVGASLAFPVIRGLALSPIIDDDGALVMADGYHKETGLYFDVAGVSEALLELPTRCSKDDAVSATGKLLELVDEVPFVGDDDRAVWLSIILSSIMAPTCPPPIHVVTAPDIGAGKTLTVRIAALIGIGRFATVIPPGADEIEDGKRFDAAMLSGDPVLVLDNVRRPLTGDGMAANLTALPGEAVATRVLGTSNAPRITSRPLVCVTGRNVTVRDDVVRRTIVGMINPMTPRGAERDTPYKIPDLVGHVRQHRLALLRAALILLRAHAQSGEFGAAGSLDSFELWSKRVASAIAWAGVGNPIKTTRIGMTEDEDVIGLVETLEALRGHFGGAGFRVADVLKLVAEEQTRDTPAEVTALVAHCAAKFSIRGRFESRRLGDWFRYNAGRTAQLSGGEIVTLKRKKTDGDKKVAVWQIADAGRPRPRPIITAEHEEL